jgi:quercetin dioxygenase-like cupin family protein
MLPTMRTTILAGLLLSLSLAPMMTAEEPMKAVTLEMTIAEGQDQQVAKLFENSWTKLWQITLRNGKTLAAHVAKEQVTIHCISGSGVLVVGEERIELKPGVIVPLEANISHAVESTPAVSILVTRFMPAIPVADEHEH